MAKIFTTGPRGEAYQRRKIRVALEDAMERANKLPPSAETQILHDGLRLAYHAVYTAQRKHAEV